MWSDLNEYLLLAVFDLLPLRDLVSVLLTCRRWSSVAGDNWLWRRRLRRVYRVPRRTGLPPGAEDWWSEFRRLHGSAPVVLAEELREPAGASCADFAQDGSMLATGGLEGRVAVYSTENPCQLLFSDDLSCFPFHWRAVSACKFNPDGTMLLVTGIKEQLGIRSEQEMLVFSIREQFEICARMSTSPGEAGGCWYNSKYVVSADFKWLAHRVSTSMLWVNKINQLSSDSANDYTLACMRCLAKIYNPNGSAVRHIQVCNAPPSSSAPSSEKPASTGLDDQLARELAARESRALAVVPVLCAKKGSLGSADDEGHGQQFVYTRSYYETRRRAFENGEEEEWIEVSEEEDEEEEEEDWEYYDPSEALLWPDLLKIDEGFEVINEADKLLLFTTSSEASSSSSPTQIGVKRLSNVRFRKHMDLSKSLQERVAERKRKCHAPEGEADGHAPDVPDWLDYGSVWHLFDPVDVVLDFGGRQVVGYDTSPDARFLYANCRGATTTDAARATSNCFVIDLSTFETVGELSQPSEMSQFRSGLGHQDLPAVTKNFVALLTPKGDEDDEDRLLIGQNASARLYDRHYGVAIGCFPQGDLGEDYATSVALSQAGQNLAVTVSKSGLTRIWRSIIDVKQYKD